MDGTSKIIPIGLDELEYHQKHGAHLGASQGPLSNDDKGDIRRLKRSKQLQRRWRFPSLVALMCLVMATWQTIYASSPFALINGGRAGLVWGFLLIWFLTIPVVASVAEMASMVPTSGGQYQWISEFAPASIQSPLSYIAGWLTALGYQAFVASVCYGTAALTLNCFSIGFASYEPKPWHVTIATIGTAIAALGFNVFMARCLPYFDGTIMVLNIIIFFAQHMAFWIVAPKASKAEIFLHFENRGGWSSEGAATVVGLITAASALVGIDAPAHLAEEVKEPARNLPKVMIWSFCFAGVPGFVAAATMASVVQDIDTQIVQSTAAFPWIDLAVDSVGKDLALGILCPQIVVAFAMAVSVMAPASRQALAFSEDGGLVFPKSLCRIRIIGGTAQPVNAMLLSLPVCMVAACLNLAGSEVFNSIIGLLLGAVNLTLIISIGSVLWRRTLGPEQSLYGGCRLPPAPWSLGRLGVFINAISVLYLGFITVISYFPVFSQVTPNGMNWGVGMFMGAMLVSLAAYMFWGRRKYTSPATKLRREGPTIHAASAAVE